jgi:DNA-binding winged helix-turn-helix (wHTH) protein
MPEDVHMNTTAGMIGRAESVLTTTWPDTRDFRIEDWLVQPARNQVVRDGTVTKVRPQLIDVLACLASRPGRVVSKEQLLSEVWKDRFVGESGVARCVAELRQLLADDAKQPRIIETISKRGYRIVAPVEFVDAPAVTSATVTVSTDATVTDRRPRFGAPPRWLTSVAAAVGTFLRDGSRDLQ